MTLDHSSACHIISKRQISELRKKRKKKHTIKCSNKFQIFVWNLFRPLLLLFPNCKLSYMVCKFRSTNIDTMIIALLRFRRSMFEFRKQPLNKYRCKHAILLHSFPSNKIHENDGYSDRYTYGVRWIHKSSVLWCSKLHKNLDGLDLL